MIESVRAGGRLGARSTCAPARLSSCRLLPDRRARLRRRLVRRRADRLDLAGRRERPAAHRPEGEDWRTSWGGGLVTTCGLRNVGAPSEGYGLHGEISQQPDVVSSIRRARCA